MCSCVRSYITMDAHIQIFILVLGIATVQSYNIPLGNHERQEESILMEASGDIDDYEIQPFFEVEIDVTFLLYTRKNPKTAQKLLPSLIESIIGSNIDFARPTIISTHGFLKDAESSMNLNIRDAYLQSGDVNFIVMDWSKGASASTLYVYAKQNVYKVAPYLGQFLRYLETLGLNVNELHLVGHSLGAHVVGLAAATLGGRIASVVGLDPALPLFNLDNAQERIDKTNAQYVEIIHTNGGKLGVMQPLGDADFYPNGGRSQPGCGTDILGKCSHSRAHLYFAESILSTHRLFIATKCQNFQQILDKTCYPDGPPNKMGGTTYQKTSGVYNVVTGERPPFALG